MTLREAFKAWAMAPRNMLLAKNSRNAVEKVLMRKHADIDLEQITRSFVVRLLERSTEDRELCVKAVSILSYVLQWGGDHGYCQRPSFDYSIVSQVMPEDRERDVMPQPLYALSGQTLYGEDVIVKVKPAALERRRKELEARNSEAGGLPVFEINGKEIIVKKEITDTIMNEKKRGKAPHPCVQIDVETLKPVKTWPSITDAQKELGVRNVNRAIGRKGIAGGYYWCNVGDEHSFVPNKSSLKQSVAEGKKKERKGEQKNAVTGTPQPQYMAYGMLPEGTVVMQERADISTFTNDELIAEMRRRGWKGEITITLNVAL